MARAIRSKGKALLVAGAAEEALTSFEEARALLARSGDTFELALTADAIGLALSVLGDSDRVLETYEEAWRLFECVGALREEGVVASHLANLYIDQGRFDDALVCCAHAAAIHGQLSDRLGLAFATANRACLEHVRENFEAAEVAYDEAIANFRQLGARGFEGAFRGYRALCRLEAGAPLEEVRSGLCEAVSLLRQAKDPRFEALFLSYLGACEARSGALARARKTLEQAERLLDPLRVPVLSLAVSLQWGHLERAEAQVTDPERSAVLLESFDRRLRQVRAGDPPPVRRHADVLLAARILAGEPVLPSAGGAAVDELRVAADGRWFAPPGGRRVELVGRAPLRRVLLALVEGHLRAPGTGIEKRALIAAGWPGERLLPQAAANRLRVAISTLRKLGLHDAIVTRKGTYLIHPALSVRWEEGAGRPPSPS